MEDSGVQGKIRREEGDVLFYSPCRCVEYVVKVVLKCFGLQSPLPPPSSSSSEDDGDGKEMEEDDTGRGPMAAFFGIRRPPRPPASTGRPGQVNYRSSCLEEFYKRFHAYR